MQQIYETTEDILQAILLVICSPIIIPWMIIKDIKDHECPPKESPKGGN